MISFKFENITFTVAPGVTHINIRRPDGKTDTVYPFRYVPARFDYDIEGNEMMYQNGKETMRCRYTPDFEGDATIEICSSETKTEEFTVLPSPNHGYVGISRKNGRYFACSDGTSFFPIGINLAFPTCYGKSDESEFGLCGDFNYLGLRQYERWFAKCAENGVNVARIWLGHEYFSPDTENTYEYNYMQFSKIDALLALARRYNIKLKLTIEQFRFFDYERKADTDSYSDDVFRKFNKRLSDSGKRCENIHEWLTEKRWQDAWLSKIDELSKRYSGDTGIFAIELWNEMNAVGTDFEDVLEWNRIMLPEVKKLFPKHIVVNSLGSIDCPAVKNFYDRFYPENSDFVQIHRYLDIGAEYDECKLRPTTMIKSTFDLIKSEKPVFLAETGAVSRRHSGPFRFYSADDRGILFADFVYTPVFTGCAGTGNIWHWDDRYVEAKNLYHMYRPITELIKSVDFESEDFVPEDLSDKEVNLFLMRGKTVTIGYLRNKDDCWQKVLRDLKEPQPIESLEFTSEGAKSVICYPIWDDDRVKAVFDGDRVKFINIDYGVLFKITKN